MTADVTTDLSCLVDGLRAQVRVCREDAARNAERAEAAEVQLAEVQRDLRRSNEDRNRLQVSERQAREKAADLADTVHVDSALLEAERGLFVPVPAGHMLSVTVTPYDSAPVEDAS